MFVSKRKVNDVFKDNQELTQELQFMQELKSQLETQLIRTSRESREKSQMNVSLSKDNIKLQEDIAGLERELGHAREELRRYKMLVTELMKLPAPQPQVTQIHFSGQPTQKI